MVKHFTGDSEIEATLKQEKEIFTIHDEYHYFESLTLEECYQFNEELEIREAEKNII